MKIARKTSLFVALSLATIGITTVTLPKIDVAASTSIPSRMRHKWVATKWGETFKLNLYKNHANFYDGTWKTLKYKKAGYNTYYLVKKNIDGLVVNYKNPKNITVSYDIAKLHFKRLTRTKPFHGYRIETVRYDLENTFYDQKSHSTLSDYQPTQKSKVIFLKGTHVMPTHHEWDWFHGKYLTEYKYKKGIWHKIETEYVGN